MGVPGNDGFMISKSMSQIEGGHDQLLKEAELATAAEEKETHSFEIEPAQVENVKQRCLPNALNYPMLEEYDFRNDTVNPDLDMELKPQAQLRPYQEKSLSKMFGNAALFYAFHRINNIENVWAAYNLNILVENVKQRCLPNALNYPMLEEYDFRNDTWGFSYEGSLQNFGVEFGKPRLSAHHVMNMALYVMNPNKFRACEFLIRFHEQQRGDKIIVFADNLFALTEYAIKLRKPMIYGATSHVERTKILEAFKTSREVNTVFLSKVGDNSIDIPEANVIIQISSHAGSRRQEAQRLGRILRAKNISFSNESSTLILPTKLPWTIDERLPMESSPANDDYFLCGFQ
ncbi:unnamed protein product [Ilex paraguariensis]|uniref:Helicase C-terminal domain-containing protein n=1 Tax=Ilex paraguariensis TaxID=185542 RepID=A0ABC8RAB2_9AQUA